MSRLSEDDGVQSFDFFIRYNKPCLLGDWASRGWVSRNRWDNYGLINFDALKEDLSDAKVPVVDCDGDANCATVNLFDFIDRLRNGENALYLKDWHFCTRPENLNLFSVPPCFKIDWLNDYLVDREKEDYRFLYFGGSRTWTPFHVDVLHSYSWSVNVIGRKLWYFLDPAFLTDEEKLNPIKDIRTSDRLFNHCVKVEQSSGEAIFVPSGWYHQVFNLEPTISINHNWFNAFNVYLVLDHLRSDLSLVEKEIAHLRSEIGNEFDSHCQTLLRANSGLNFGDFVEILRFASTNERYDHFQKEIATKVLDEFSMLDF